jgi:hypothetical protein
MALVRPTDLSTVVPSVNSICDQIERWARGEQQVVTDPKLRGELLAPSSVGTAALTAGGVTLGKLATSFADAPPGYVVASGSFATTATGTSNTEGGATQIISTTSFTADGSRAVLVSFFADYWTLTGVASGEVVLALFDSSTVLGTIAQQTITGAGNKTSLAATSRVTPSAGSHTLNLRLWTPTAGGTAQVIAGNGGTTTALPAVMQVSVI